MLEEFKYNNGEKDGIFRISASQFSQFMDRPWEWYREKVLGEDGFTGNTSSVLGTIVHVGAELVSRNKTLTREDVEAFLETITDPEIDKDVIREQYPEMLKALINDYVLPNASSFHEAEPFITADLGSGIEVGGSIDRVEVAARLPGNKLSTRIVDYKTYNSKSKPKAIPMYYKYQLLIYAWVYGELRHPVSEVRLVYINRNINGGFSEKTGKPLKSYPPEVTVLTEQVTKDDIDFIKGLVGMCKDTLLASEKYPELLSVLWRDPRLAE